MQENILSKWRFMIMASFFKNLTRKEDPTIYQNKDGHLKTKPATIAASKNDNATAGPACSAATTPGNVKIAVGGS
jgi:hypothetical protein